MEALACEAVRYAKEHGPRNESGRIRELDGLRGIAILTVIGKHYIIRDSPLASQSFFGEFIDRFFREIWATDLFFVITGFLIGRQLFCLLGRDHYYSQFYLRRIARTVPVYYLLIIVTGLAVLAASTLEPYLGRTIEWPYGTPWSLAIYATFFQSFLIATTGEIGTGWLYVTWSVAVQEQFYFFIPWFMRLVQGRRLAYAIMAVSLLGPVSRLIVVYAAPPQHWFRYGFLTCCHLDTLATGVLAACYFRNRDMPKWLGSARRFLLPLATLGLLAYVFTCFPTFGPVSTTRLAFVLWPMYRAVMYLFIMLAACFASDGLLGRVLRLGLLREMGFISYGLFLFHEIVRDFFFRSILGIPIGVGNWEQCLATFEAFLLTVALAEVSWRVLEKPIIAWSKG